MTKGTQMTERHRCSGDHSAMGAGLGVAIGAGVGTAISAATGQWWWIGVGAGVGVALGAGIGSAWKKEQ